MEMCDFKRISWYIGIYSESYFQAELYIDDKLDDVIYIWRSKRGNKEGKSLYKGEYLIIFYVYQSLYYI